ncbi:hypothetical protein GGS26DRAFT_587390 [Hypomontagnella submonticulosa]|nr:hypothetical protein GGS26DRAFT_587390 [Hypomontagnella submonticulosa]
MSASASKLARAGRRHGSRISATTLAPQPCQRRYTSWIAWEQPNPALYAPPTRGAPTNETQQAASKSQGTRNVGKAVTAPATTVVAGGIQEVSTSGKTVPPSIQAGISRAPYSQTRSIRTQANSNKNEIYLPTTLLRIPGMTVTWPEETPAYSDQARVRKLRTVHQHGGPSREQTPLPDLRETLQRVEAHRASRPAHIAFGSPALKEGSYATVNFGVVLKKYMDGVRERAELAAAAAKKEDDS